MENELEELAEKLAEIALQREQERREAHEQALKELAAARETEEKRQAEARAAQQASDAKAEKRKAERLEAEAELLREEAEHRRLIEQEENKKQEAADKLVKLKESIKRHIDELEHAEELAKKQLRDLVMRSTQDSSERIVPNPLERFLQTEPK